MVLVLSVWLLLTGSCLGEDASPQGFQYDRQLAGELLPPPKGQPEAAIPLGFDATVSGGDVRISTGMQVSPYLEAVGGPQPTVDELRLLPDKYQRNPLERYQLGAGIGIAVEDRASLSLGYRFHQPFSLLEENRQAVLSGREDLRVFFDVKLPLD